MRYNKVKGNFVKHTVTRNSIMDVDILTDNDNLVKLGGKQLFKFAKMASRKAAADTGASLCCTPATDISELNLHECNLLKSNLVDTAKLP